MPSTRDFPWIQIYLDVKMFATIRVNSWDEACAIGAPLRRWGFRGQSDESWEPESTLLRACKFYGCKPEWLNNREYWMLRQFQRRFSAYAGTIPTPASKLDWLAVMQHYGSATRLVDFSHSFYVAAFFAVERSDNDAAVWAVSKSALARRVTQLEDRVDAPDDEERNIAHSKFVERHLGLSEGPKVPIKLAVPVEPEFLHDRLITQQGFFLCPLDLTSTLVENLEASFDPPGKPLNVRDELTWETCKADLDNYAVLKIILPHQIHGLAVKDLDRMNINSGTLFPGLDGYARSMAIYLRTLPE